MEVEIKKLSNSESNLVIELFDKYRIFYKQPSNIELAASFIQGLLANNESVIFVALVQDGNRIMPVGFTQLYPKYSSLRAIKNWLLNDLYVELEYRKQGIGGNLIKAAMDYAREDGASFVELSTAVDNLTAQKLYELIGFEKQKPNTDFLNYKISVG